MNCIDLFAGAGGLSEGFIRAGYNIIAHVEKDYPASLTLKTRQAYYYLKNNNKLNIYTDYLSGKISREILYSHIPQNILDMVINLEINDNTIDDVFNKIDDLKQEKNIDIIIGGPPCQAYSLVGRARVGNKIKTDQRNYLYKQYLKFLHKYNPNMFVFENVKGILSAKNEKHENIFNIILKEINELGYHAEYKLLNSKDFGVLQSRERIIIIGWKKDLNFSFPEFQKIQNNLTIKDLFIDLPKIPSNNSINFAFNNTQRNIKALRLLNIIDKETNYITQHISRFHNKRDLEIYKIFVQEFNNGRKIKYNELPTDLITHKNLTSFLDRFRVVNSNGISHTVVSHISKDGHYYIHPDIKQNRSLTVREAARIQSFPDNFYFENSRTAAFTQIGNAVPPLMAEQIALKLKRMM